MDHWNQGQRMIRGQQQQTSFGQNPNILQNFYRPSNPQQFYPNQGLRQNIPNFQNVPQHNPRYPMSSSPQQFMTGPRAPPGQLQPQQQQPSRQLSKTELEEMRKKKHFEEQQRRLLALKQKGGQSGKGHNPLNSLFGKKGNVSNNSSLLGSLVETSKPKTASTGFSSTGSAVPNQTQHGPFVASSGSVVTNQSQQGQTNFQQPLNSQPSSENFADFQGFTRAQDDFGDFQHGPANSGSNINVQTTLSAATIPSGTVTVFSPVVSANKQPDIVQSNTTSKTNASATIGSEINQAQAAATPSIEELMKKSLTLDNDSQKVTKMFQKPKRPKFVKSEPKHFKESASASKWENLESLSEVFTIPQPVMVPPEPATGDELTPPSTSNDEWSDFSGAEQNSSLFHDNVSKPVTRGTPEFSMMKAEQSIHGNVNFAPMTSVPVSSVVSTMNSGLPDSSSGWAVSSSSWEASNFGQNVPDPGPAAPAMNQPTLPVQPQSEEVDPEKQIYGVRLPLWSKDTSLLPAVYKQVYAICSKDADGISTSQLYPILLSSELSRDKLGHIWSQSNKATLGQLNEQELYLILGMVALAQVGLQTNTLTLEKLASCTTPPIPSFPERIFQTEVESNLSPPTQKSTTFSNEPTMVTNSIEERTESDLPTDTNTLAPLHTVDAVKQPDWSKWKTSKASNVDDKFKDFDTFIPKDRSESFKEQPASGQVNLNYNTTPMASFGSFQDGGLNASTGVQDIASLSSATTVEGVAFGVFAGTNIQSVPQSSSENKSGEMSSHFMSVPLQPAQRYNLNTDDDAIDHHEKPWLKCLNSCFQVITKSYQILQTITDPELLNEVFSSREGISHFSAIIEIYCVSQRIKASVLKSAPNNIKLKESLQNIDNVWKTFLGFPSFSDLLPVQSLTFSGCHMNEDEDLNLTCGVCLLNVDKSWINSLVNKGRSGKLTYGSRYYHTTCANFWCNKVDSVLPALQLNVGNSLI